MESALANEPEQREQTFGLWSVCVCTYMFPYRMGIQFLYMCKKGLCSVCSAVTGIRHSVDTTASLVSNLPLLQSACVCLCACVCVGKFPRGGRKWQEANGVEVHVTCCLEKCTWSGFKNNKKLHGQTDAQC